MSRSRAAGALAAIPQSYRISPAEARRLAAAVGAVHPNAWYDDEPSDPDEQAMAILAMVHASVVFDNAFAAQSRLQG